MKNNRVPPSASKRRNDDPSFSLIESADQRVDCTRFEKRLIPQSDENSMTMGTDFLKTCPDRGTHAHSGKRIDDNSYFPSMKQISYPLISNAEDDD
jgi:hypothetical protein